MATGVMAGAQNTSHIAACISVSLGCWCVLLLRHRNSQSHEWYPVARMEISVNIRSIDKKGANETSSCSRNLLSQQETSCCLKSVQVMADMLWPIRMLIEGSHVCMCVFVCVCGRGHAYIGCALLL